MKIVENGRAVCSISLPESPTPREAFAADGGCFRDSEFEKNILEWNNLHLMRMVWRYTDLEVSNPPLENDGTFAHISMASDESGELWHMHENFDSFTSGKEGFGIAIPVKKRSEAVFGADKWYLFE